MTKRSSWLGIIGAVTVRPGWPSGRAAAPAVYRDRPGPGPVSLTEIRLDDGFRNLLANAMIARHRPRITQDPELMFLRET